MPSALVFVVTVLPVPTFVMATSAPTTDAPWGSVTVPVKTPLVNCACAGIAANARSSSAIKQLQRDAPRNSLVDISKQFFAEFMHHPRAGRSGAYFGAK